VLIRVVCSFGTAKLARYCLRAHLTLLHTSTDGHYTEFTRSLITACMCVACQVESSVAGFTVHGTRRSEWESGLCSLQQLPCTGVQEGSKGTSMLNKFLIFRPNAHLFFQYVFLSHLCYTFRCVTYIIFREYLLFLAQQLLLYTVRYIGCTVVYNLYASIDLQCIYND
jgi:hypothetical protein